MADVVRDLQIEAEHVIFGHTHRRGAARAPRAGRQLWNTGSWVHSPGLLGETAAVSPYWPGTICLRRATRASRTSVTCSTTSSREQLAGGETDD